MRSVITLLCCTLAGCFYVGKDQFSDIIRRPSSEWSSRDCLTIVLEAMHHNFLDQNSPNIKVMATPYTPWVIAAINRISQTQKHWSEGEYQHQVDTVLKDMAGLYLDWERNRFVDSRGNYVRNVQQMDSLMFLVTLRNNSWPCNVPYFTSGFSEGSVLSGKGHYASLPFLNPIDWPCYIPDITDLDARIFLENDNGLTLEPKYVWGRKNNQLSMEETLLVMFPLRNGNEHFFDGSENIYLVLNGFDSKIRLTFPLSEMY